MTGTQGKDAREIIATALAGEAKIEGAGPPTDPIYWFGPYADIVLRALAAAGLRVVDAGHTEWGVREDNEWLQTCEDEEHALSLTEDEPDVVVIHRAVFKGPWLDKDGNEVKP